MFAHSVDDLAKELGSVKCNVLRFIHKNFDENIDYVSSEEDHRGGGRNKITTLLTEKAYNLCKTSYNIRKYTNVEQVRILTSLENRTIDYIVTVLKGVVRLEKLGQIGLYKADVFFPDHNLVIECDEIGHVEHNEKYMLAREEFIIAQGHKIIRFNPSDATFEMAFVLRDIMKILYPKEKPSQATSTNQEIDKNTKKRVVVINATTKQVIKTFDSRKACAEDFKIHASIISNHIKYSCPMDNLLFMYEDMVVGDVVSGAAKAPKQASNDDKQARTCQTKKRLVVVDVTTKKVIKVFDSLKACAADLSISPSCICGDVKFARVRNKMRFMYNDNVVVGDIV